MTSLENQVLRNYRILDSLGRGGMGTVYRASVLRSRKGLRAGQQVALKVLHTHLAQQDGIVRRFRREAGLGLAIRHPQVMATYDLGAATVRGQQVQFIVMELMDGRTLEQILKQDGPLPESDLLKLGQQVAEGLEAFHSRGVIHRDVKPSNLFLDRDGNARIGDLGLSRRLEPSTEISLPGTFLGSAAYAAPEQIETEDVGPAVDLYALGVTLYELASGANPFAASDLRSTLLAHEKVQPEPLGRKLPGCSYFLEQVVAQLLQKDPARRLGPAGRVARIFGQRERSGWWRDFVRGEGDCADLYGSRGQFKLRRATRLHGREAALEQLADRLRTATVGRTGQVAVVIGEEGVGKTRLIDAALQAHPDANLDSGPTLLVSRFLPQATPVPYFPLNEALLAAFELKDLPRARRRLPLIERLRAHLPERSALAGRFAALIDNHEAESVADESLQDAIPGLFAEAFRTLSVRRPVVLVIEELQWADLGSLRVLEALAGSLMPFPLALVMSSRPELPGPGAEQPPAHVRFLAGLSERPNFLRLQLERLSRQAVLRIVRDVGVGRSTEKLLAARLFRSSEGNPAFLFALIEDLRRRGDLFDVDREALRVLPLPSSVNDFLERRLQDLDPAARRLLEFASVFGTRFKLEPVVEGLALDLVTASELIGRLTSRYQLIRAFDQAYRFDHHLLRERVYREIPPDRRREYHGIVAGMAARETAQPHDASRAAYEAGIHYSLAEIPPEAARYLVGAVRYLMQRSLVDRAERLALQAEAIVSGLPDDAGGLTSRERFLVFECVAAVSGHLGKRARQGRALVAASRVANGSGDRSMIAEVHVLLARHDGATGRILAALSHAEAARVASAEAGNELLEAAALRVHAGILRTLGGADYDDLLMRADALARKAGDEQGRAFGLLLLGQLYITTDRPATALSTLKQALELFEADHDERGRGRAFYQLARVYRMFADLDRAEKSVELAARIARTSSDRGLAARCQYLRGDLAMRRRRFEEAERLLVAAVAALEAAGDRPTQVYALIALALLKAARHNRAADPEAGAEFANRAVSLARELGMPRQASLAYAALAFTYLAQGRHRFAHAVSRKGLRFLEQREGGRRRAAEVLFVHYRCLKALGRKQQAPEILARARDLVLEQAREIENDSYRKSFLERDPFNLAVLRESEPHG